MASAASTTFFSYWLTWRSTSEAKVAGGAGEACACGAGEAAGAAGFAPPCANALTANVRIASRQNTLICFILKLSYKCDSERRRKIPRAPPSRQKVKTTEDTEAHKEKKPARIQAVCA